MRASALHLLGALLSSAWGADGGFVYRPDPGFEGVDDVVLRVTVPATRESASANVAIVVEASEARSSVVVSEQGRAAKALEAQRFAAGGPEACVLQQLRFGAGAASVSVAAALGNVRFSPTDAAKHGVSVLGDGRAVAGGGRVTDLFRGCGVKYTPPAAWAGAAFEDTITLTVGDNATRPLGGERHDFALRISSAAPPRLAGCEAHAAGAATVALTGVVFRGGVGAAPAVRLEWATLYGGSVLVIPTAGVDASVDASGDATERGSLRAASPDALRKAVGSGALVYRAPSDAAGEHGDFVTLRLSTASGDDAAASEVLCAVRVEAVRVEARARKAAKIVGGGGVLRTRSGAAVAVRGILLVGDGDGGAVTVSLRALPVGAAKPALELRAARSGPSGVRVETLEGGGAWPPVSASLNVSGSVDAVNSALDSLWFLPPPGFSGDAVVRLAVVGGDGGGDVRIRVTAVDDGPKVVVGAGVVGGAVDCLEDETLRFGSQASSGIGDAQLGGGPRADLLRLVDVGSGDAAVTLRIVDTAAKSTFALVGSANAALAAGLLSFEVRTSSATLTGTARVLAAALADVEYQPESNWHGVTRLDAFVDGALGESLTVNVQAVNDAPRVAFSDGNLTILEDASVVLPVFVDDDDADDERLEVTVSAAFGSIKLPWSASAAVLQSENPVVVSGFGGNALTKALAGLTYTPPPDFFGEDRIVASANDGRLFAAETLVITVAPVNDAPRFGDAPVEVVFTGAGVALGGTTVRGVQVSDVDGDVITVVLSIVPRFNSGEARGALEALPGVRDVLYSSPGYSSPGYSSPGSSQNLTLVGFSQAVNAALSLLTYVGDDADLVLKATDPHGASAGLTVGLANTAPFNRPPTLAFAAETAAGLQGAFVRLPPLALGDADGDVLDLRAKARAEALLETFVIETASPIIRGAVHCVSLRNSTGADAVTAGFFRLTVDLRGVPRLPRGADTRETTGWIAFDAVAKVDDERRGAAGAALSFAGGAAADLSGESVEAQIRALSNVQKALFLVVVSRDDYASTAPRDADVKLGVDSKPREWRVTLTGATPGAADAEISAETNSTDLVVASRLARVPNAIRGTWTVGVSDVYRAKYEALLEVLPDAERRVELAWNATSRDVSRALEGLGIIARVSAVAEDADDDGEEAPPRESANSGVAWRVTVLDAGAEAPREMLVDGAGLSGEGAEISIRREVARVGVGIVWRVSTTADGEAAVHAVSLAKGGPGFLRLGLDTRNCSLRAGGASYGANGALRWTPPIPRGAPADVDDEYGGSTPRRSPETNRSLFSRDATGQAYGATGAGHSLSASEGRPRDRVRGATGSSVEAHLRGLMNFGDLGAAGIAATRFDGHAADSVTWRLTFAKAPHCLPLLRVRACRGDDDVDLDRLKVDADAEAFQDANSTLTKTQSLADRAAVQSRGDASGHATAQLEVQARPLAGAFQLGFRGHTAPLAVGAGEAAFAEGLAAVLGHDAPAGRGAVFDVHRAGPDVAGGFTYHVAFRRLPLDFQADGLPALYVDGSLLTGPRSKRASAAWREYAADAHLLDVGTKEDVAVASLAGDSTGAAARWLSGSGRLHLRGRPADLLRAVSGLVLRPAAGYAGVVAVDVQVGDDAAKAFSFVDVHLAPVNDAPNILWGGRPLGGGGGGGVGVQGEALSSAVVLDEDTPARVVDRFGAALHVVDVDAQVGEVHSLTLAAGHGTLAVHGGNASETVVLDDVLLRDANAALQTLTYMPRPDWHGVDVLRLIVVDASNASTTGEIQVVVRPVNDFPVWDVASADRPAEPAVRPGCPAVAGRGTLALVDHAHDLGFASRDHAAGAAPSVNATRVAARFVDEDLITLLGAISLTDADVDSADAHEWLADAPFDEKSWAAHLRLDLRVGHGKISLMLETVPGAAGVAAVLAQAHSDDAANVGNVEVVEGDSAEGSRRLVLRGHAAAVRLCLAALAYTSDLDWNGIDVLYLNATDGGDAAFGSGGLRTATAAVAVQVSPTVDHPRLILPDVLSLAAGKRVLEFDEDTLVVFGGATTAHFESNHVVAGFSISDADVTDASDVARRWLLPWTFDGASPRYSGSKVGAFVALPSLYGGNPAWRWILEDDGAQRFDMTISAAHGFVSLPLAPVDAEARVPARTVTVFNQSLALANRALVGMAYLPDANWNSDAEAIRIADAAAESLSFDSASGALEKLTLTVSDSSGGQVTKTLEFAVRAVNDAPVLDAATAWLDPNAAQADGQARRRYDGSSGVLSVLEGGAVSLGASLRDVDAAEARSGVVDVTLVATHGTFSRPPDAESPFRGEQSRLLFFSAPADEASNTLAQLRYVPDAHYAGSDSVLISVSDRGNSGFGGVLSDSLLVLIDVMPTCDAPKAAAVEAAVNTAEDAAVLIGFGVQDDDHANLASLWAKRPLGKGADEDRARYFPKVRVSLTAGEGTLTLGAVEALTFLYGETGAAESKMTFEAEIAHAAAAVREMVYTPRRDFYSNAAVPYDTVQVLIDDLGLDHGGALGGPACAARFGTADVKVRVLARNDAPVVRVPGAVFRTTGLAGGFAGAAVRGDLELVRVKPSIISEDAILDLGVSVSFSDDSLDFDHGALGALSIAVSDHAEFAVELQNGEWFELPFEGSPLEAALESEAKGSSDDDAAAAPWRRRSRRWLVSPAAAVKILATLQFRGAENYFGEASISIGYEDGGFCGGSTDLPASGVHGCDWCSPARAGETAPSLFDHKTLPVTVTPVADAPFFASDLAGVVVVPEDVGAYISKVSVVDADGEDRPMTLRLTVARGVAFLAEPPPERLAFLVGDGSADRAMLCAGPLSAINAALERLRYSPPPDFSESYDKMTLVIEDGTGETALLEIDILVVDGLGSRTTDAPKIGLKNSTRYAAACQAAAQGPVPAQKAPICAEFVSVETIFGFVEDVPRRAFGSITLKDADHSDVRAASTSPVLDLALAVGKGSLSFGAADALVAQGVTVVESEKAGEKCCRSWLLRAPARRLEAALGAMAYVGASDFHGVDALNLTLVDGRGGAAAATLVLVVASAPDLPRLQRRVGTLDAPLLLSHDDSLEALAPTVGDWATITSVEYLETEEDTKVRLPTVRVVDADADANDDHLSALGRGGEFAAAAVRAAFEAAPVELDTKVRINVTCTSGRIQLCAAGCDGAAFIYAAPGADGAFDDDAPKTDPMVLNAGGSTVGTEAFSGRPQQRWWRTATMEGSAAAVSMALWDWHYRPDLNFNSERAGSDDDLVSLALGEADARFGPSVKWSENMLLRIRVRAVNDSPVVRCAKLEAEDVSRPTGDGLSLRPKSTLPLFTDEDVPLELTDVFTVRDVDVGEGHTASDASTSDLTVTVTVDHGSVAFQLDDVSAMTDVLFLEPAAFAGDPLAWREPKQRVEVRASPVQLNHLLAKMTFIPDRDWFGRDAAVHVSVDDRGNFGSGGPRTASTSVRIRVRPVNDAPALVGPDAQARLVLDEHGDLDAALLVGCDEEDAFFAHQDRHPSRVSAPPLGAVGVYNGEKAWHGDYGLWRSTPARPNVDVVDGAYDTAAEGDQVRGWRHARVSAGDAQDAAAPYGAPPRGARDLVLFRNDVFFAASDDGDFGEELWRSDGRVAQLAADVLPGPASSSPRYLTNYHGLLYFSARGVDTAWRVPLEHEDECGGSRPSSFAPQAKYVVAEDTIWVPGRTYDCPLGSRWATTAEALAMFTGINAGSSTRTALNDHTPQVSQSRGSEPKVYFGECGWDGFSWGGKVREHFRFADSHLTGAFKHAGAPDSRRPDFDIGSAGPFDIGSAGPRDLRREKFGGILCVDDEGPAPHFPRELWVTDGTPRGTVRAAEVNAVGRPAKRAGPKWLAVFNGALFFSADDGVHGPELFRFVGDDARGRGTATLVSDARAGPLGSAPMFLTSCGGALWFAADDGINGAELWVSDGSLGFFGRAHGDKARGASSFPAAGVAGTALARDVYAGPKSGAPDHLHCMDRFGEEVLVFAARDEAFGNELWRATPSSRKGPIQADVLRVRDVHRGRADSDPRYMVSHQGDVYFSADDGEHGAELWRSDGTASGTALVADVFKGLGGSRPAYLAVLDDALYFFAQGAHRKSAGRAVTARGPSQLYKYASNAVSRVYDEPEAAFDVDRAGMDAAWPRGLVGLRGALYYAAQRGDFWHQPFAAGHAAAKRRGPVGPLAFSAYDVDGPRTEQLTLSLDVIDAGPGGSVTLSLGSTLSPRVLLVRGGGVEDTSLELRGTALDLNRAMASLRVTANGRFHGLTAVRATLADEGVYCAANATRDATCLADAVAAVATAHVFVRRLNDAPTILAHPGPHAAQMSASDDGAPPEHALTIRGAFAVADDDVEEAVLQGRDPRTGLLVQPSLSLFLKARFGTLTLGAVSGAGVGFLEGNGADDSSMQLFASLADLNAAVETLHYRCVACAVNEDTITATIDDGGFSGAGGPLTATATIAISLLPPAAEEDDAVPLP